MAWHTIFVNDTAARLYLSFALITRASSLDPAKRKPFITPPALSRYIAKFQDSLRYLDTCIFTLSGLEDTNVT